MDRLGQLAGREPLLPPLPGGLGDDAVELLAGLALAAGAPDPSRRTGPREVATGLQEAGQEPADGSHVVGCGVVGVLAGLPEAAQAWPAPVVEQDVRRLDVAVDDAEAVEGVHDVGDRAHDAGGLVGGERAEASERRAGVAQPDGALLDAEQVDHARVAAAGEHGGLTGQPGHVPVAARLLDHHEAVPGLLGAHGDHHGQDATGSA